MFFKEHFREKSQHEKYMAAVLPLLRKATNERLTDDRLESSVVLKKFIDFYHRERNMFERNDIAQMKQFIETMLKTGIIEPSSTPNEPGNDPFVARNVERERVLLLYKATEKARTLKKGERGPMDALQNAHPLLRDIGLGHTHIEKLSQQLHDIDDALKEKGIEIHTLTPAAHLKEVMNHLIEGHVRADSHRLKEIPEGVREANAIKVNSAQERYLQEQGMQLSMPFKEERRLVLYFREEDWLQMDAFLFCVNYLVCKWYVEQSGYSSVLNKVQVVSRKPNQYPKALHTLGLRQEDYLNLKGNAFMEQSSVGANTVHFTHGTVHGRSYGSTAILGTSTRNDEWKMSAPGMEYVPLPLYYFRENTEARKTRGLENNAEEDFSDDLYGTTRVMIDALRTLETDMLRKAA